MTNVNPISLLEQTDNPFEKQT